MVFQSECRLYPINSVLEAVEDVAELVPDVRPQKGAEQEDVEEDERHETRVEADGDVRGGVVEEGEEGAAGHLVDGPGLDQDRVKRRVTNCLTENGHYELSELQTTECVIFADHTAD